MSKDISSEAATLQCDNCFHWQNRGGLVLPRARECTLLEGESSVRMVTVVTAMAQVLAKSGQCPSFSTMHAYEDGYISQDIGDLSIQTE